MERILPNAVGGDGLAIGFHPAMTILMSAEIIRQILSDPREPHVRRAPDRLRGGPDTSGGARRDAARD